VHPLTVPIELIWGSEAPESDPASVPIRLSPLLLSPEFANATGILTVALGVDNSVALHTADLALAPHLLIAGSSCSGKSTLLHTLLASLLVRYTPDELRLIVIDTGGLELTAYNGAPHLRLSVVTDVRDALKVLKWARLELEVRERLLAGHFCRTIAEFNRRAITEAETTRPATLPRLVIAIDDAGWLTSTDPNSRDFLSLLAEHGRPLGVHLVLVTSHPTAIFAKGDIKRLIPSRIALHLPTRADSRAVVDHPGAADLATPGAMLYVGSDTRAPTHLRAPYLSHRDTDRLVTLLAQRVPARVPESPIRETIPEPPDWLDSRNAQADPLLYEAAAVVIAQNAGSTAVLQRRLKIGYGRAARLLDQLHLAGVVGPPNASEPRAVRMSLDDLKRRAARR
jgi:S-DNA-T family DNA segregation ATPase FtsK/SpoIIIE